MVFTHSYFWFNVAKIMKKWNMLIRFQSNANISLVSVSLHLSLPDFPRIHILPQSIFLPTSCLCPSTVKDNHFHLGHQLGHLLLVPQVHVTISIQFLLPHQRGRIP